MGFPNQKRFKEPGAWAMLYDPLHSDFYLMTPKGESTKLLVREFDVEGMPDVKENGIIGPDGCVETVTSVYKLFPENENIDRCISALSHFKGSTDGSVAIQRFIVLELGRGVKDIKLQYTDGARKGIMMSSVAMLNPVSGKVVLGGIELNIGEADQFDENSVKTEPILLMCKDGFVTEDGVTYKLIRAPESGEAAAEAVRICHADGYSVDVSEQLLALGIMGFEPEKPNVDLGPPPVDGFEQQFDPKI